MKEKELTGVERGGGGHGAERRRSAACHRLPTSWSSRWSGAFRWRRCDVRKKGAGRIVSGWAPRDPAPLFITLGGVVGRRSCAPTIFVTAPWGAETARVNASRGGVQPSGVPRSILGAPNRQGTKSNRTRVTGRCDGSWDPQDVATVPRVLRGSEKEAFGGRFVRIQWRAAKCLGAVVLTSASSQDEIDTSAEIGVVASEAA